MADSMDVDMGAAPTVEPAAPAQSQSQDPGPSAGHAEGVPTPPASQRDTFREIMVKVHIRRPERDSWQYLGRAIASCEMSEQSSRVVVRSQASNKILTQFDETSDLQAEKRGNFVVIGMVDGARVVSWSLNAPNNSETIRLLASIDLSSRQSKQAIVDSRLHGRARKRIERIIKDDRRRRHRRRKEADAMVDAFSRQTIQAEEPTTPTPGSAVST